MAARRQRRLAHRSRRPRSRSSTRPTPPRSTGTCTPSATASRKSTPRPPDRLPRAPQPRAPPAATTADSTPSTSGVRGRCEVRDAGLPVSLTDEGPTVHEADLDEALNRNERARAVLATETHRGRATQPGSLRILGDRLRTQQGQLAQQPSRTEARPGSRVPSTRPVRGSGPRPRHRPHDIPQTHRSFRPQRQAAPGPQSPTAQQPTGAVRSPAAAHPSRSVGSRGLG